MKLFEWDVEYSVKVAELDDQHKILLGLMNEAYTAIMEKQEHINVSTLLAKMSDYAISHFSKEEKLLRKYEYDDLETQQEQHNRFFDQIALFKKRLSKGDPDVMDDIANFLSTWLHGHIKTHDKKYSLLLNENGIT